MTARHARRSRSPRARLAAMVAAGLLAAPAAAANPGVPPRGEHLDDIELEGRVRFAEGECPDRSFRIANRDVVTTSATYYDDGDCDDVREGREVIVEGYMRTDGKIGAYVLRLD